METLQHHNGTFTQGIIIALIGFLLCYFVGRRRFNRRGIGSLQHYNSPYEIAIVTTIFEKLVKLIGIILLLTGLWIIVKNKCNTIKQEAIKQNPTTITHHPKK